MTSALFVVTEEGYWGEECVEPLRTLDDEGFEITVATPSGSKPVIDPTSTDPDNPFVDEETAKRVQAAHENDDRLNDPIPVAAATADGYDAVVFPGGHGAMWDVNHDVHARRLLSGAVEGDDGTALVLCHAVGLLAFTRDSEDELLVNGRDVTGFPNEWEEDVVDAHDVLADGRKLPYWVEDEVKAAGANWDAEVGEETSVTVDGDLVTGRGPVSSRDAAATLLEELDIRQPA